MAISSSFEVMNKLLGSIKQIDRILNSGQDNIIEDTMIAVKEINLDKFDDKIKNDIVNSIRTGLLIMYKEQQTLVNKEIGLGVEYSVVPAEVHDEKSSEALDVVLSDIASAKNKSVS